MARRKTGLSAPTRHHANKVSGRVVSVKHHAQLAMTGSCQLRFTSLEAAVEGLGKLDAHAFESGGRVAKGALTPKTVTTEQAKRVYAAQEKVATAMRAFRVDCIKDK